MKKISILASAAMLAVVLAGCSKEHQCKCVYVDEPEEPNALNVIVVDGSIGCEDITEIAYEQHTSSAGGEHSLEHVQIHKVNCRNYGE